MHIIHEIDAQPPQVMIQVLMAEVDLTDSDEFGVEIGLQSPILFSRSVFPSADAFGAAGSTNIANAAGGLVAPGVTINSSIQQTAFPGFNFNNTAALGNNPNVAPGVVGFQGINNLGVGRTSSINNGIGGFVFSAASDAFTLLIRALKTQGRIDILSRPQVMAVDNQTAFVQVGSRQPYVANSTISALGNVVNTVNYQNVGIILNVTPKINPDGTVMMRVDPQISSVQPSTVNLGNGVFATAFNIQEVQTTVVAGDGETVAIGGLIASKDTKTENKIPWLGDLPYVGACFRFRSQQKTKTELLVILTPHIVRSRAEADRVLAEEARRMDWCLGPVVKTHGTSGMEPIFPPPRVGQPEGGAIMSGPTLQGPGPFGPTGQDTLPQPRVLPSTQSQRPAMPPASSGVPVHTSIPIPPPDAVQEPSTGLKKESSR
jgi:type II secretory pathway component GspD/PulD (secretin)